MEVGRCHRTTCPQRKLSLYHKFDACLTGPHSPVSMFNFVASGLRSYPTERQIACSRAFRFLTDYVRRTDCSNEVTFEAVTVGLGTAMFMFESETA